MQPILTPEKIKPAKGRKLVSHEEHMAGSVQNLQQAVIAFFGALPKPILNSDGRPFCTDHRWQHLLDGSDPDDCVTCSFINAIEGTVKCRIGDILPIQSRRELAVRSGTEVGVGNSDYAVIQALYTKMVAETDCPSNAKSLDTFYASLPKDLKDDFTKFYDVKCIPLAIDKNGSASSADIDFAMSISPFLVVTVDGRYQFNNDGQVIRTPGPIVDNHDVCLVFKKNQFENRNVTVDSENPDGFVPFDPNYDFHYPVLVLVKKKYQPMLYKQNGQPAIYYKVWNQDLLVPFSDGVEVGGDHFRSLFGVTSYDQLPVQHVDVLPFPVAPYCDTTVKK